MAALVVLAVAPALTPRVEAAVVSRKLGPVHLVGVRAPRMGPSVAVSQRFKRAGWLKGFEVHVVDASGRKYDQAGIFCHALLMADAGNEPIGRGIMREALHLTTAEGQNAVLFPEGFGVPVDSTTRYMVDSMLQSPDPSHDGKYFFDVRYDVVYAGEGPPLKPLTDVRFNLHPEGSSKGRDQAAMWDVPPGLHVYRSVFVMPFDATVHYISTHIHNYVTRISLLDAASGKTLYRADVVNEPVDGWPRSVPAYSSAEGFAVRQGQGYVFELAYRNPLDRPLLSTMGLMRLYVHKKETSPRQR